MLRKVAGLLGTLVEVDKATLELEELEYARFSIRVLLDAKQI